MPDYQYKVLDALGRPARGMVTAEDEGAVLKKLVARGYSVVDIKEIKSLQLPFGFSFGSFRLSLDNSISFFRQFGVLIKAGLPLFEILSILIEQEPDKQFRKILDEVRHDCAEGRSLADAFRKHPGVFSEFFVNMVMVGEASGDLEGAFNRVLKFAEEEREIRSNVRTALTYPVILVIAGIVVILTILVFILPQFVSIFESAKVPLPLPTIILITLSRFIKKDFLLLIVAGFALYFGGRYFNKTKPGKEFFDKLKINLPVIGPLLKKMVISRMTRVLGTLDESGVPLLSALEITQRTTTNVIIARSFDKIIGSVRDGKGIAAPMRATGLFPPMVVAMVAVGEESGYLEKMLQDVADFYEKETFYTVKQLIALIEPITLIFIGIAVTFIAAALLLPMFRLTGLLRRR